jgi:hypothetical protein
MRARGADADLEEFEETGVHGLIVGARVRTMSVFIAMYM